MVGSWALVALAAAHLLGHVTMVGATGDDETERRMLELMRSHQQDFGWGFVRSMMDLVAGFSLAFAVLAAGIGLLNLVLLRHMRAVPDLLRSAAVVNAGVCGVMTGVALRYWFIAPLAFLALAFVCFVLAVAFGGRAAG